MARACATAAVRAAAAEQLGASAGASAPGDGGSSVDYASCLLRTTLPPAVRDGVPSMVVQTKV